MMSALSSVFGGAPEPEEKPALPSIPLGIDTLLDLLKNQRRRHVINVIAQCGQLNVGDAAEVIAAREYDKPATEISKDQRKRLYVSIYQTHAPKLADHGLIEFDKDNCILSASPHTETAEEIAGALDEATVSEEASA